jgi:hydroxymethylglutaryl-CoA reductase
MALHARNIAVAAGVPENLVDLVVEKMVKERRIRMDRAQELAKELASRR